MQETLVKKASTIGQALALGSAFMFPNVGPASAGMMGPLPGESQSVASSLSGSSLAPDYSADMARARHELGIVRSLLDSVMANLEAASLRYLDRLGAILDAAIRVTEKLPEHSRALADSLQSARAELLAGMERLETWSQISRLIDPGSRPVLPDRFIVRRAAKPVEISSANVVAAAYLRSDRRPQIK